MKWVTRARPKVDRVACPWLIKRFVDPRAEFLYVPADQVIEIAKHEGAIPFDVPNVELGHHGSECSFDAILRKYNLKDPALEILAPIVRGADTDAKDNLGIPGPGGDRRGISASVSKRPRTAGTRDACLRCPLRLLPGENTTKVRQGFAVARFVNSYYS